MANNRNATAANTTTNDVPTEIRSELIYGAATVRTLTQAMKAWAGRNGSQSCKILEVVVPVNSAGICVVSGIYGQYTPTSDGYEISFAASVPRNVYFESDEQRAAFLAHAEIAAIAHPMYFGLAKRAQSLLLGESRTAQIAAGQKRPDMMAVLRSKSGEPVAAMPMQPTA